MNSSEAIEIKTSNLKRYALFMSAKEVLADKLSIEALKRHKALDRLYPDFNEPPLPGETQE